MDVDKIGFTGSAEVGKLMMVYAGQSNMKRVTTECGGKTPQIITGDVADIETAVQYASTASSGTRARSATPARGSWSTPRSTTSSSTSSRRRRRTSSSRAIRSIPRSAWARWSPASQQKRVLGYIDIGKKEGAKLQFGGSVPAGLEKGNYVAPTLFTGVNNKMRIAQEEIFGPVARRAALQDDRPGDRDRQRFDLRARRQHLDQGPQHRPQGRARPRSRAWSGSTASTMAT